MITAKQILEKYFGLVRDSGYHKINVYINPDSGDILDMKKRAKELGYTFNGDIRFTAIPRINTVYVWDAWVGTHDNISNSIPHGNDNNVFCGIAKCNGSKFTIFKSDQMEHIDNWNATQNQAYVKMVLQNIFSFNWSWLDRYISGASNYIENYHKKYSIKFTENK